MLELIHTFLAFFTLDSLLDSLLEANPFVVGYYVLTVGVSLLLVKETKKRLIDLRKGVKSIKYAPISFAALILFVIFVVEYADSIPILNWSWLGYNIAFGPFIGEGFWGVLPFIPILLYMFIHINYVEEFYFRKSKKLVVVWALAHIAMGVKVYMVLILLPIGFLFKYIYDKHGVNHSYALHFATNILVVIALFLSFA